MGATYVHICPSYLLQHTNTLTHSYSTQGITKFANAKGYSRNWQQEAAELATHRDNWQVASEANGVKQAKKKRNEENPAT